MSRLFAAIAVLLLATPTFADDDEGQNHYREPGFNAGRDYVNQHFSEHIDPFTGNLQLHYVDIFIPGNGGFDIKVQRAYNAMKASSLKHIYSPFGSGWDIHFGRVRQRLGQPYCSQATSNGLVLELPDGSEQAFYRSNGIGGTSQSTDFVTIGLWKGQCDPAGGMVVHAPDGTRYDMTTHDGSNRWLVTRITDRNGNQATYQYQVNATLGIKIPKSIDAFGQTSLVTFGYQANGSLSTITAQGRTWNYTVGIATGTDIRLLTEVRPPVGNSWRYDYYANRGMLAGSYTLQRLAYPQSGTISYNYAYVNFLQGVVGSESSTVITSKTTADGTWSYSYTPSTGTGTYDVTTVNQPETNGNLVYRHFGYRTVTAGSVWKIGLLAEKAIGNIQTETYAWSSLAISNESILRPGYFTSDPQVFKPLMSSRTIRRDGQNHSTTYSSFDTLGNPESIAESGTRSRSRALGYENNTAKWILGLPKTESVSGIGTIRSRQYDTEGNLTSDSRSGVTTTYGYNTDGSVNRSTNGRGHSTTYSNHYRGVPRTESRPESVTLTRSVDSFGNVTQETVGGRTWSFGYDNLNRLTSVAYPLGSTTTIAWTDVRKFVSRGSYTEEENFDDYGRLARRTRGGIVRTFQYDALGRKTFESFPSLATGTTYTLDDLGRVTSQASAHGTRSYTYMPASIRITNERSMATTYSYDRYGDPGEGFVTNIDSPAGTSVDITRDVLGNITAATQGGVTRTYGYNGNLFLTSITEPETGTTTFGRDAVGNMTSKTIGGRTTAISYDGLDRVTSINYPGATGTVSYQYNARSQVTRLAGGAATRNYEYDANGNLTLDSLVVDGRTFDIRYDYSYTSTDAVRQITYPGQMGVGNRTIVLGPDSQGRPTAVSPFASSVTYHASGNLASVTFANNLTTTFGQHASRLLPNGITVGSGAILDLNYVYDPAGNVTSLSGINGAGFSSSFQYDGADRLTSATGPWGAGQITYSGSGNITQMHVGGKTRNYYYTSGNRLTAVTLDGVTHPYAYDTYGSVTDNGRNAFTFDDASNLACVDCDSPADRIDYAYDGRGWRVWQEKYGVRTYFVHAANGDLLFEYRPAGNQWKQHAYLQGKRIATRESDLAATTTSLAATTSGVCELNTSLSALVSLTASVAASGSEGTPTGTVTFAAEGRSVSATLVNGVATVSADDMEAGFQYPVTAQYSGDETFAPSESSAVTVCVVKRPVTMTLAAVPAQPAESAPFTANVTVAGTSGTPTGVVRLLVDNVEVTSGSLNSGAVTFTVGGLIRGSHTLAAAYAGDAKYKANSKSLAVWVGALNAAPTVSLTGPPSGSTTEVTLGLPVSLQATASDSDGTIASVTFNDGGQAIAGNVAANGSTYSMSWIPTTLGSHSVTATAIDNLGTAVTSTPATVNVVCPMANQPPVAFFSAPTNGQVFAGPLTVRLQVQAADSDTGVASVEFFLEPSHASLGVSPSTTSPYTLDWAGVGGGTHTVSAVVRDSCGATTTTGPVTFTVEQPIGIANGSFESPVVTSQFITGMPASSSWVGVGTTYMIEKGYMASSGRPAPVDGNQVAAFGGASSGIRQSVYLVPGTYAISLAAMYDTTGPMTLQVRLGGQQVGSFALANRVWTQFTTPAFAVAAAGLQELELTGPTSAMLIFVDNVRLVLANAGVSAALAPSAIDPGGVSQYTVTLSNPNSVAITGVAFTAAYPSGVTNAAAANPTTTCGPGTVTAANGGTSLSLAAGTIPAGTTCTVSVRVTSATAGSYPIATGNVTTANAGMVTGVSATLVVNAIYPQYRSVSGLRGSGTIALPPGTQPTDWLVMYLVSDIPVPTPSGWTLLKNYGWTSCACYSYVFGRRASSGTGVTYATNGLGGALIVAYQNVSGVGTVGEFGEGAASASTLPAPSITPQGASSVVVGFASDRDSSPTAPSGYTTLTSAAVIGFSINIAEKFYGSTAPTGSPVWTQAVGKSAVAVLVELKPTTLNASAAFAPASVGVGQPSVLTIALSNGRSTDAMGVSFASTLPAGLTIAAAANATTTCSGGAVSAPSGGTGLALSNAKAPANGSCTVSVNVTGTAPGAYTYSTGAISTSNFGTLAAATATVSVNSPPGVTMAFSPASTYTGSESALTITLSGNNAVPVTGVSFSNTYPSGLVNTSAPGAATTCPGGIVTAAAGGSSVTLAGASIPASGACTVTVKVTSATAGSYIGSIAVGAVTTANAGTNLLAASATVSFAAVQVLPVYRSVSGLRGSGTINFPLRTQPTDWLVMYMVSDIPVPTPSGWTLVKSYGWTSCACYSYVFSRRALSGTSVTYSTNGLGGAVIVAYENVSGVGAVGEFGEGAGRASTLAAPSITPQSASSVVVGFGTDQDGNPTAPADYTSMVSLGVFGFGINVAQKFYGNTAPTGSPVWTQAAGKSAVAVLVELKP